MLLIAAGRHCQARLEAELGAEGLSLRHLGVLGHLSAQPDLSYSELGRRARVSAQAAHSTVRSLLERGAVVAADVGRGEPAQLQVTDQGRALLAMAAAAAQALDVELFGSERAAELRASLGPVVVEIITTARRPPG